MQLCNFVIQGVSKSDTMGPPLDKIETASSPVYYNVAMESETNWQH